MEVYGPRWYGRWHRTRATERLVRKGIGATYGRFPEPYRRTDFIVRDTPTPSPSHRQGRFTNCPLTVTLPPAGGIKAKTRKWTTPNPLHRSPPPEALRCRTKRTTRRASRRPDLPERWESPAIPPQAPTLRGTPPRLPSSRLAAPLPIHSRHGRCPRTIPPATSAIARALSQRSLTTKEQSACANSNTRSRKSATC